MGGIEQTAMVIALVLISVSVYSTEVNLQASENLGKNLFGTIDSNSSSPFQQVILTQADMREVEEAFRDATSLTSSNALEASLSLVGSFFAMFNFAIRMFISSAFGWMAIIDSMISNIVWEIGHLVLLALYLRLNLLDYLK